MLVQSAHGAWMAPPSQGIWIPAGVLHAIIMLGPVATRSVYLDPDPAQSLSSHCRVVGIAPLLRQLLIAAVDLPAEYDAESRAGRIMSLLISEIEAAPDLPLSLPLLADGKLAQRCRRFIEQPTMRDTIDTLCRDLAMSRRRFTREFRHQTGLSFAAWQRRACLLSALPRLSRGDRVTTIAFDLGYARPAAFTAMFRHAMGMTPGQSRRSGGWGEPGPRH